LKQAERLPAPQRLQPVRAQGLGVGISGPKVEYRLKTEALEGLTKDSPAVRSVPMRP
jgi:hypothetical protein